LPGDDGPCVTMLGARDVDGEDLTVLNGNLDDGVALRSIVDLVARGRDEDDAAFEASWGMIDTANFLNKF